MLCFHIILLEKALYLNNLNATTLSYNLPKGSLDSYEVMTSNVNSDAIPTEQFFIIAFCAVSQPLNRKITKMVLRLSLRLKSYLENCFMKIIHVFC